MEIIDIILIVGFLFPGMIWVATDAKWGVYQKIDPRQAFMNIVMVALIMAALVRLIYLISDHNFSYYELLANIDTYDRTKVIDEMFWSSVLSAVLSYLGLYISKGRLITQALVKLKATNRSEDGSVWSKVHNSKELEFNLAHLYDLKNQFVYIGNIKSTSEKEGLREILFHDVEVYDFNGNLLSQAPQIYVSCPEDNIRLEFYNYRRIPR